jgi:hypothetical protein
MTVRHAGMKAMSRMTLSEPAAVGPRFKFAIFLTANTLIKIRAMAGLMLKTGFFWSFGAVLSVSGLFGRIPEALIERDGPWTGDRF